MEGYTEVPLSYGRGQVSLSIPKSNLLGVIEPKAPQAPVDENRLLAAALAQPLGSPRLRELVHPGEKIAIVTSDLTRPCPSESLLPWIAAELGAAGIPDRDVFIVMGLGLHRLMSPAEMERAVGAEMARRWRVLNHDAGDTVRLGVTSAGTPVEIFRPLVQAERRICLGAIEFHYFAGYSGGAKAVFPGCASRAGVTANHAMMVRAQAAAGRLEDNPLRQDIEEAAALLGIDFILNVVVDKRHRIQAAFAGQVTEAHRAGCELVAGRGKVRIPRLADIVVASAGGFPKDINLYQAHKALDSASYFVRPGGALILAAECAEGFGNLTFEQWMRESSSPHEVLAKIQAEFVLGGHKAAAIAAVQTRAQIYLVSAMDPDLVRQAGMRPCGSPQEAFQAALDALGQASSVLVLPAAASILPEVDPAAQADGI